MQPKNAAKKLLENGVFDCHLSAYKRFLIHVRPLLRVFLIAAYPVWLQEASHLDFQPTAADPEVVWFCLKPGSRHVLNI